MPETLLQLIVIYVKRKINTNDEIVNKMKITFTLNEFKVKWWITFNEPRLIRTGYGDTNYAPGLGDHGVSDYIAAHNVLRTHGKVYHLYNQTYKPTQQGSLQNLCRYVSECARQVANNNLPRGISINKNTWQDFLLMLSQAYLPKYNIKILILLLVLSFHPNLLNVF